MSPRKTLHTAIIFLCTGIILVGIMFANFYHRALTNFLPFLPWFTVPALSSCVIIILGFEFWSREREIERLKYEFFTIVTHKFRTPLTGIKWALQMLRKDMSGQDREDLLKHMETTNERLMEIVDLLVGFVKFDDKLEYAYEATSLREIIDASLAKYGQRLRTSELTLQINAPETLPLVIIDKRKIQFVIDMLIDNAIKYTPKGGSITLDVTSNDKTVLLAVRDTGIGIDPRDMRSIFKRFFRTADAKHLDIEGMGLGLYTIKTIVEKHGGRIWATSDGRNKGTTFYVELKPR